ncbi:MAG: ABC transporter permease, partial [Lachnospiraceae bacterium]|nr:ABC transporter permease [Lachnospiraceae bacterium]
KLLDQQYDVIYGRMPEKYNEVVLIVSGNNEVTDYTLYSIGVLDSEQLGETLGKMIRGEEAEWPEPQSYSYEELCGLKFKLMLNSDYYAKENGVWVDKSKDEIYMMNAIEKAETISIVGILKSESEAAQNGLAGTIGYRTDLMEHLIDEVNNSEIVREQKANPDTDIFTGIKFEPEETEALTWDMLNAYIMALPDEERTNTQASIQQMRDYRMSDEKILETLSSMFEQQTTDATYEDNLRKMGVSDPDDPSTINLYPKDFESKDALAELINEYNRDKEEDEKITYTDLVGLIMSSVSTIINAISYILIAFVSISLVVSSIMIGIITYISVLERTKEIGILRAIGASKKDISRVFNAETLIVGFTAGLLGIVITFLLLIPINIVIKHFTDIAGLAVLPYIAAGILILISMLLTFIAGLFPSRIAAKKDPVVALRTE